MPINIIEKKIRKNPYYKGRAVNFNVDTVRLPDGKTAVREYLDHPGAVAVLPILKNGNIVMVRQYRYPIQTAPLEIPAGKMHSKRDNPLARAKAELKEETGYTGKINKMLSFWPCCAFSNEELHIYLAKDLKKGKACPDEDEFLRVEEVPFVKALKLAKSGKIKDAKTVIAILHYASKVDKI